VDIVYSTADLEMAFPNAHSTCRRGNPIVSGLHCPSWRSVLMDRVRK